MFTSHLKIDSKFSFGFCSQELCVQFFTSHHTRTHVYTYTHRTKNKPKPRNLYAMSTVKKVFKCYIIINTHSIYKGERLQDTNKYSLADAIANHSQTKPVPVGQNVIGWIQVDDSHTATKGLQELGHRSTVGCLPGPWWADHYLAK